MGTISSALKSAHKTLDNANKFESSANREAGVKPAAAKASPSPSYTQARDVRKSGGEFMGVKSDQAPELNTALDSRANAKKALEQ